MAKGKYREWVNPETGKLTKDAAILVAGWGRDGLTDEQIAGKMRISPSTLYEWERKFPEISEAIKKGKEIVDYEVENALLLKALAGNVTAQIFWLKNRRKQNWRDKPQKYVPDQIEDDPLTASIEEAVKHGPVRKAVSDTDVSKN